MPLRKPLGPFKLRVYDRLPARVRVTKTTSRLNRRKPVRKGGGVLELRVDGKVPCLGDEAPTATQLDGRKPSGKRSGLIKLRIDNVFAFPIDVAVAAASTQAAERLWHAPAKPDCRQTFAELIGAVELRVDRHLSCNVHISPLADTNGGQSFRENLSALELGVDDQVTGTRHESQTPINYHWVEHIRSAKK